MDNNSMQSNSSTPRQTVNNIDKIIAICKKQGATDIHLSVGQPPICRINGDLLRLDRLGILSDATVKLLIEEMKIFIQKYKSKVKRKLELNKILILQRGNPEIIFQICLGLIESPVQEIVIAIQDFCLGQNMLLILLV